jgi:hypothetical protein
MILARTLILIVAAALLPLTVQGEEVRGFATQLILS